MKINSLNLKNYRSHSDLTVNFQPRFNVVVGVNGSGKTSMLKGLCDAMSSLFEALSFPGAWYQPLSDATSAKTKVYSNKGRLRFEQQFPVSVGAQGESFGKACVWTLLKSSQIGLIQTSGVSPGHIWLNIQQAIGDSHENKARTPLPVIAFYRASRFWTHSASQEIQAATLRQSRTEGYTNWWDASIDSAALQTWVISKCLERLQTSSESGTAFDEIKSDELALVNQALSAAIGGIKGLRYDLKQKSLLVEWDAHASPAQDPTPFENLSDGQRAVVGLVADIARRMCLLNPHLDNLVITQTPGIVLIDELDIHLHPKWQRNLTSGLKRAFPSIQFIVASHSPQVIGELQPEEILLIKPEGISHPQVSYGLTSSQVLEEIMGAGSRASDVDKSLSLLFEALERSQLQLARDLIVKLKMESPGIPELAGAEVLLRRKEVLGR